MRNLILIFLAISYITASSQVIDITILNNKENWIVYNDKSKKMETAKKSGGVTAIWASDENNFWVGTGGFVYQVQNKKWIEHPFEDQSIDSTIFNVNSIFQNKKRVWFTSRYYGIAEFKNNKWTRYYGGSSNSHAISICEDNKKNIVAVLHSRNWISKNIDTLNTINHCLVKRNFPSTSNLVLDHKQYITSIHNGKLQKLKKGKWEIINLPDSLNFKRSFGIKLELKDKSTYIWLPKSGIQEKELVIIKKKSILSLKTKDLPKEINNVTAIKADNKGNLWICDRTNGYFIFNGKHWTNINSDNSVLEGSEYNTLFIDKKENYWFGTNKGLYILKVKRLTTQK